MLRAMQLAFDHAVIVVPALADAVREWTAAGFVVTPGGRHDALPTENALVVFADGGYLELLALRDDEARESLQVRAGRPGWAAELRRSSAIARRFLPRLVGAPGVADYVLRGAPLERLAAESRRRGFALSGPVAMSRALPDGTQLDWRLLLPAADRLPFFIEDVTPRERRVPGAPAQVAHPNGALGVAGVTVRVAGVPASALEYADFFGAAPRARPDGSATLALAGLTVALPAGEPARAAGLTLRGVTALPPALEALGVRGAGEEG